MCEIPNEMYILKRAVLPSVVAAIDQSDDGSHLGGFAAVFEMSVCGSLVGQPKTEAQCVSELGCRWEPSTIAYGTPR